LSQLADVDHIAAIKDRCSRFGILVGNTLNDDHRIALLDSLCIQVSILLRNTGIDQSIVQFRFCLRCKRSVCRQSGRVQIVHCCSGIFHALE